MAFKLTLAEGLALYNVVQEKVGLAPVLAAVSAALGPNRAQAFVSGMGKLRLTNKEKIALVLGLAKLVPGTTTKDKMLWLLKNARSCFDSDARFKEAMAAVAAELNKLANAADDPPFVADDFLRFYGRVNMWAAAGEDELRKDIAVCKECRVGYHIEMAGWRSGETAFDGEEKLVATIAMFNKLIGWCRAAKIPLFTSITNRNITETKYENVGRPFASIVPAAQRLAQAVYAAGPEGQYVQPVAENNGDTAAVGFEKWCGELFKGWNLVYNGNGGQATKAAHGWPMFSYHPASVGTDIPNGALASSDHGLIIRALASDSSLDGPGNPGKIRAWFDHCKASGAIGATYYAFRRAKHDPEAIRACGKQEAAPAQAGDSSGLNPSAVSWLGTSYAAAKQTVTLSEVSMSGNHLNFKASSVQWPAQGEKKCKAVGLLIRKIGDRYVGGKVEWCVVERGWYDIKTNTADGYNGATMPNSGETVWAGLGHPVDGSEISTLLPVVWK